MKTSYDQSNTGIDPSRTIVIDSDRLTGYNRSPPLNAVYIKLFFRSVYFYCMIIPVYLGYDFRSTA